MKAYELLTDPERWCQGTEAKDAEGNDVSPESEAACRWCAFGAVRKCYPSMERFKLIDKLTCAAIMWGYTCVGDWNDSATHEAVLKALVELDM